MISFLLLQEKIFDNFNNLMILWILMMETHVQFLILKIKLFNLEFFVVVLTNDKLFIFMEKNHMTYV